ncbi:MAG: group 2 family glycosyl transferase [uncultured bacterium]|uniref:Glycosyl transferase, group 2 family protein n=1 Tax=Candidatus Woesebacteria bacterium GW2011_GWA1_40_43 TaxID=1618553 RepID=A0A0G0SIY5_9BACT|nr:MAG: group 2 family glycosyl transferase [uncultured bacterium]KKR53906.1 MAG: Glycosyl transferase, group 2 family protein [Candidatus Woesebacteria bacterium GW2011_GWD2_40_19]KKR58624.1 MAG: Glycosyl transferase, group 2 family protein [Candidatus Woesebacteria bacterium GW2011_GWC2_40_30]KKR64749.1 MAG: Glycosyl transferase, group 2 family protein [Candidatus Woesebacteria bacterium GW2011_GWA1_40_43]HAU65315.1 hypothetical protein [Candidatus Woesebacteria bacterium]
MKLSIILPARNEETLIRETLRDTVSFLQKRKISGYEILVIINGTTDSTKRIVSEMSFKNKNIRMLKSKPGYGLAIRKGFREANGDYIAIFNVDFYDLKMLDLVNIDLYGKDLIIGSKMTHWSEDKRPVIRRLVSKLFNLYLKIVYRFKGSDTHGIKVMKKNVADRVLPRCKTDSGIFDTEFVLRAQKFGFKIADFAVAVREKRSPRFNQRILQTLLDIWKLYKALNG